MAGTDAEIDRCGQECGLESEQVFCVLMVERLLPPSDGHCAHVDGSEGAQPSATPTERLVSAVAKVVLVLRVDPLRPCVFISPC